ncbi:type II toxin-antitoxin system PemI/MazE family antitoxin [Lacticaseibacillus zeae]|uniref:AbrB family transcriptional regulator n=1 Tax=Lacticaseibacillus zeae subsp. silagei TaxID=3068307 RepID=A0ABD7Z6Q5_LACZE|nr:MULTISPECIES: AbrB family transcriptional regulator [Lacticaseibacillus]MDE3315757.1 AbrB family transcriptional regulator [Lacticaseibacillus zeae]OFR91585.1 AbrB family transcriptional regulator [Lactobacillus sp. HMSC068F07]WLV82810.1 AbrB family transcriptional regulator [Lacticaseibacillus sp. NCIMB 15475]WLV85551.1 AbrB family transcriptional regulator [Lacticaseibacillus sp. NCIMB 15474]
MLETVKTQRQGNTIMVPIPTAFNISENAEYQPTIDKNGVITLVPIKRHIFESNPDYDLRKDIEEEKIGDNGPAVGRENMWDV